MDIISLEQSDRLYWLGRYSERAYTTIGLFFNAFDTMIDKFDMEYKDFCRRLNIPNVYENSKDFCMRYTFDAENDNSIISNLKRTYDNGITLREEIGSDALSFIQLAVYDMQKAEVTGAPLIEFQKVRDNLMAFWGVCDDHIANPVVRNILKLGKRHERIDLFSRLGEDVERIQRETVRFDDYLKRAGVQYNEPAYLEFKELLKADQPNFPRLVELCEVMLTV